MISQKAYNKIIIIYTYYGKWPTRVDKDGYMVVPNWLKIKRGWRNRYE